MIRKKVVFFDLGETLIELSSFKSSMHNTLKKHLSQPALDFDEVLIRWGHETHRLFIKHREGDFIDIITMHFSSLKNILKTYDINITDELAQIIANDVWQDFIRNNKLCLDVMNTLNQLKQSGYKLGLITDSDLDIVNGIIQKHKLKNYFETIIVSSELEVYKPNLSLFNEAIKSAKCSPDEALYVGDSEMDIKGAVEVGMTTVIINRNEIPMPKIGIKPDFKINSLLELPKIMSEINNKKSVPGDRYESIIN